MRRFIVQYACGHRRLKRQHFERAEPAAVPAQQQQRAVGSNSHCTRVCLSTGAPGVAVVVAVVAVVDVAAAAAVPRVGSANTTADAAGTDVEAADTPATEPLTLTEDTPTEELEPIVIAAAVAQGGTAEAMGFAEYDVGIAHVVSPVFIFQ